MALEKLFERLSIMFPYVQSDLEIERRPVRGINEEIELAEKKLRAVSEDGETRILLSGSIIRDSGGVRVLLADGNLFPESMINLSMHRHIMNNYDSENFEGVDAPTSLIPRELEIIGLNKIAKIPLRLIQSLYAIPDSNGKEKTYVARDRYIRADDRTPTALQWVAYKADVDFRAEKVLAAIREGIKNINLDQS